MNKIQKDYKDNTFSIINNSEILSKEDFDVLERMDKELEESFLTAQLFRTRTEMEVSVLNDIKFPTPDSKYWQSVREQNTHFTELVFLSYEYRKNIIEIKKLERDLEKERDDLEKELIKIEIDKKTFTLRHQEKTAKERIREIKQWHEIKRDLKPKMSFSIYDCNEHQLVSYTQRWINQAWNMEQTEWKGVGVGEKNNLLGQLQSGVKECHNRGILNKVLEPFNEDVKIKIKNDFKYLLEA